MLLLQSSSKELLFSTIALPDMAELMHSDTDVIHTYDVIKTFYYIGDPLQAVA